METAILAAPVLAAAASYSLIYLLAGGGIFGAFAIYLAAKAMGG